MRRLIADLLRGTRGCYHYGGRELAHGGLARWLEGMLVILCCRRAPRCPLASPHTLSVRFIGICWPFLDCIALSLSPFWIHMLLSVRLVQGGSASYRLATLSSLPSLPPPRALGDSFTTFHVFLFCFSVRLGNSVQRNLPSILFFSCY